MKNLIRDLRLRFSGGTPFDSSQLQDAGISNSLAAKYVQSGWLTRLDKGIYQFAGDELDLERTLRFLEGRMGGLHIAAKSALDRHGYRQNVSFDEEAIVWAEERARMPQWVSEKFRLRFSIRHLFHFKLPFKDRVGRLPDSPNGPLVSQPECALLEMLSEVGVTQGVEEAKGIMEGLVRLRPSRLIAAVSACQMVKATRLCVIWAEEFGFEWADAVRDALPEAHRKGRWVGRLKEGGTLSLPVL